MILGYHVADAHVDKAIDVLDRPAVETKRRTQAV
jgi:hypothetical protein